MEKNGYKPLSARQMKKTTNGDVTYERLLRVIGRGDRARLERVMMEIVKEGNNRVAVPPENTSAVPAEDTFEAAVEGVPRVPKVRKKWDRFKLLEYLTEKYRELGRVPKQKEIVEWSKAGLCPSYQTCMKLLGVSSKAEWQDLLER